MVTILNISGRIARFLRDTRGAVTVDWVVLTAAIVGLAVASSLIWRDNVGVVAQDIADTASGYQIKTTFK